MRSRPRLAFVGMALSLALLLALGVGVSPVLLMPSSGLAPAVSQALAESRVFNPVTAVLLDLRGYDTMLELGVLLIAWLGATRIGTPVPHDSLAGAREPAARSLAALLIGPIVLLACYLLWAGADAPGGAFQAGALGGAAVIVARLGSGHGPMQRARLPAWTAPAGFAVFLVVAVAVAVPSGVFLDYPLAVVREAMLVIEVAAALSVASILAGLFDALNPPDVGR